MTAWRDFLNDGVVIPACPLALNDDGSWSERHQQALLNYYLDAGSGGLEGTGIGGGWQKLSYLPEANTDFVFAVIGEELGLSGTLAVVIIWMGVFLTGRAVMRPLRRDSFEWILGSTLVIQIVLQALANVAVVTAMVPPERCASSFHQLRRNESTGEHCFCGPDCGTLAAATGPGWADGGRTGRPMQNVLNS